MIKLKKENPLNIYRASAGSGKTHLLTGFYIKQLFLPEYLPESHSGELHFSEILAVTFTNKATSEMKGRIIQQLHLLSVNPEKSPYWEDVNPENRKSPDQIRSKARELLVQILNDYASFNISTIDSFFQKVVRSFARELNVSGNYEVEMDVDKILETTLTHFLDKLDERAHKDTFEWLVEFSKKRSEEGAGWDFREPLFKMAKKALTSEEYRNHSQRIKDFTHNKKALGDYEKMLRCIISDWKNNVKILGEEGLSTLERCGLRISDFSRSLPGKFEQWTNYESGVVPEPSATFVNAAEDPSIWFTKKSPYNTSLPESSREAIQEIFRRCVDHFKGEPYRKYCTAKAIARNFYELGIMANIDEELMAYCDEQNVMLLSSTNELLSRLIAPGDAPFIYEKTGARLKSYMIDEFQDTSGMQWGNFVPLIDNALSQGYQNLIVGDVKQSIYRWRGSDWGLLDSQLNGYQTWAHFEDPDALKVNWRSLRSIVDFNNQFFAKIAEKLDEMTGTTQISRIYKDLYQELPKKRAEENAPKGLVHIEFLTCKDEEGAVIEKPNSEQKEAEAMRQLPGQVIGLLESGFRPKDIAILCRKRSECCKVAETLLKYKEEHPECPHKLDIISNEALQISSRLSVQTIINVMRLLQSPDSDILRMVTRTSFLQLEGLSADEALNAYFEIDAAEKLFDHEIAHHPLYEMTEQIIGRLPQPVQQADAPFLQAFRDLVLSFAGSQGSDLTSFLQWWDQTGITQSISTPDGLDAIQILTIHKSKGLGMPAIILPYASWNMDLNTTHDEIIWCEPKEEPFTKDILLPIRLDASLSNTIFAKEFAEERLRTVIDNLNTAYVAFTRAKEAMIIMAPKPQSKKGCQLEDLLAAYCGELPEDRPFLTLGDGSREEKDDEAGSTPSVDAGFVTCGEGLLFPEAATPLPKVKILHSPLLPDVTAKDKGTYIHRVLQELLTIDGAMESIHSLYLRGIINPAIITEDEMQKTICQLLSKPDVQVWFSPTLQVLNEQSFTDQKGNLQRLDRVVITPEGRVIIIDYKTGSFYKKYVAKVRSYMELMRQIGYSDVEGYLLFIKDGKVMKV